MAEAPQQAAGAAEVPAGTEASAGKKGGGFSSYLPLIIAVVLMPVAAWVTLEVKTRLAAKKAASGTEESAETSKKESAESHEAAPSSHGSSSHDKKEKTSSKKSEGRNVKLPIPLTRLPVAFVAKDPTKSYDVDKIVVLDVKGETKEVAESDKIVVNIAQTGGSRYAVARISLLGDHPNLLERVNENRERLLDLAQGVLSSKSLEEIEKPGFKNFLRQELLTLFNQLLGSGTIQEVIVWDFIIQ